MQRAQQTYADLPMTRRECLALTDLLEPLYRSRTFGQLLTSTITLLEPFFDSDFIGVGFTDPKRKRHIAITSNDSVAYYKNAEVFREVAHESVMLQYWVRTGDHDRVLRRSDCCDPTAYQQTRLFCEFDRPNNVIQHMGTWLRPGDGQHLEVGFGRGGRTDFSIRDVTRLTFIRKHIFRAYLNVCDAYRFSSFTQGSAADDLPPNAVELQDTSLASNIDQPTRGSLPSEQLTPREREVLKWIVEGKTNQEIGIILGNSWRTVRVHCEHLFRKLNVETRTAAAVRAMELGFKFD